MAAACLRKLADIPDHHRDRVLLHLASAGIEAKVYDHCEFLRVYVHIRKIGPAREVLSRQRKENTA